MYDGCPIVNVGNDGVGEDGILPKPARMTRYGKRASADEYPKWFYQA
jgi:hypothetical protein